VGLEAAPVIIEATLVITSVMTSNPFRSGLDFCGVDCEGTCADELPCMWTFVWTPLYLVVPDGMEVLGNIGRRGWTRTSDPLLRRQVLYPPELRAPCLSYSTVAAFDSGESTREARRLSLEL
jgi:hypothetical protein